MKEDVATFICGTFFIAPAIFLPLWREYDGPPARNGYS
ncbi:hypothetical protein MuYL_3392 [Mucilaginibacter xinganensis]|uniref:Uncharacterized protein n=1 Tax=Mucilaginibacter xinganensis TaxID=1234841 RepID=A0A223NZG8_9SPHI|nr:hypothetical protein MuYL_3392 [Mucilaginibacter xinganensis]